MTKTIAQLSANTFVSELIDMDLIDRINLELNTFAVTDVVMESESFVILSERLPGTDYWRLYVDGRVEWIGDSGESVCGQFSRIGEVDFR